MNTNTATRRPATVPASDSTCWHLAETLLGTDRSCMLWGPAGTGKTYAAATNHNPAGPAPVVVTLTDETSAADLLGYYVNTPEGFKWQDGPAVAAMRSGARLVLNEIDHASGDAIAALYAIMDEHASCAVRLANGETVKPAAGFHVVATSNASPTEALRGEGIASRLCLAVHVDAPHPAAVNALPDDLRAAARASCMHADPEQRLTMRTWRAFADLREQLSDKLTAAQLAFGPARAQAIIDSLAVAAI
jgi:MoxR-like ATPase